MSLRRRLDALEAAEVRRQRRLVATIAAEYGLSPDELLAEAEAFFARSLPDQLAEVDPLAPELTAEGICSAAEMDDIKATLRREYRPLD